MPTFRDVGDAERGAGMIRLDVQRLPGKHDAAAVDTAGTSDRAQQRGLSRTVGAEHSHRLAGSDRETHVVQHPHVAVTGIEIVNGEHDPISSRDRPRSPAACA